MPMTEQEMLARIAELEKQVANKSAKGTSMRVSEKGGVSVYGLGRFPVTLYQEQWAKLAEIMPDVQAFIAEHKNVLKAKQPKAEAVAAK